jgi:N-acetyltransferase 10
LQPRFNERFILSLANCKTCLAIDDEFNILPLTQSIKDIKPVKLPGMKNHEESDSDDQAFKSEDLYLTHEQKQLKDLKFSLKETKPIGNLVALCKTYDQATSVMQLVDKVSEKSLKTTVSLTAGRGRGKSASLGISIASAIVYGFSNIFVTAPSPENLGTVFEFLFKALDALNYKEHTDYEIMQSTNPEFNHAVVRVNIFRDHR